MRVNRVVNYSPAFSGVEKAGRKGQLDYGVSAYGRIGRTSVRQYIIGKHTDPGYDSVNARLRNVYENQNLVAINMSSMGERNGNALHIMSDEQILDIFKCDSLLGRLPDSVKLSVLREGEEDDREIFLDIQSKAGGEEKIRLFASRDNVDWSKYGTKLVIDATGNSLNAERMKEKYMGEGSTVKAVVVSAPPKNIEGGIKMPIFVPGVNDENLTRERLEKSLNVSSAASCTTTCAAPYVKLFKEKYGDIRGHLITIHAATNSQQILDKADYNGDSKARTSLDNIVPATTGAAKALSEVVAGLGKSDITGSSMRVPTTDGSIISLTLTLPDGVKVTAQDIKDTLKEAEEGKYNGRIKKAPTNTCSKDIIGELENGQYYSSGVQVAEGGNIVTIQMAYDNEGGYSHSLARHVNNVAKVLDLLA